jgi:hypothetical protein
MTDTTSPSDGHTPQSWQNLSVGAYPAAPQAPAFDPRRAVGRPGANSVRPNPHPVMAPPPSHHQTGRSEAGVLYPGQAVPQAAPPFVASQAGGGAYPGMAAHNPNEGYMPGQYDQNYAAQPAYLHPQATVVEPAGGRASLMSRLTGREKHRESPAPHHDQGQEPGLATVSSRKPFLMGLLTGVVVMLILGQVFRAVQPTPDYAQALPLIDMTVTDAPVMGEPEVVAFLDTVEGLN